ncbi:MAG: metallophosphoesterase [Promethearchaeota archaeon]
MENTKPKILIASDVHLGALKSNVELFTQFLNDIISGKFGDDIQVLIILGDFLDLCVSVPKRLVEDLDIQEILRLLMEIKKKVKLIYILGNHEVPITGNILTGTYDERFRKRKKKFLKKFRNTVVEELFSFENVCQYAILEKFDNIDMLFLYDSQEQIYRHPIYGTDIRGLDLKEDYRCLILHGYQFDSEVFRFFIGQTWKSLISYHNAEVKEAFNYFWNERIKSKKKVKDIVLEKMKADLIRLKKLPPEMVDTLFSDLNSIEFNFIKVNMRMMQRWEHTRDYSYYLNGILEFLDEAECDFSEINHIIYGHSHQKAINSEVINNHSLEIVNDGAWQHVQPSFVEILSNGKINIISTEI